jgi:chromosome segregation ATPase
MPKPTFSFSFILKFTERMTFDVEAHLLGEVSNIHDISNLDFSLVATFHQDILDYIAQQINEQFKTASKAEKGEIDSDKGKVADAKRSLDDSIAKAKQALDAATASWKNKSDSVHKSFEDVMNEYNGKVKELQGVFDAATVKYKQDLANAQTQVSHANADRASKLAAAQQQVQKAQAEWAGKINDAQHNLDSANQKMNADFGNAEYVLFFSIYVRLSLIAIDTR